MKTERRHELRTNELGTFLFEANDWTRRYGMHVVGAVAIGLLAVFVVRYLQDSRARTRDAAVLSISELAFTPAEADASFTKLDDLISSASDRDMRMTALVRKGVSAMNLALHHDGFHPEYFDRAEQAFKEIVSAHPERMPAVAMALSELATIEESRFVVDHDIKHRDVARACLERLQNEPLFKGTPFQTDAANRLLKLDEVFQVVVLAPPLPLPPELPTQAELPITINSPTTPIQIPPVPVSPPQGDAAPVEPAPQGDAEEKKAPDPATP